MHWARSLPDRLPATLAALTGGRIDLAKARVICDGTHMTSPGVSEFVETSVLPVAPSRTTGWLRSAVRKAVMVADPDALQDKRVNAEASARVELWETPDDTANLAGCDLPLGEASRAFNRITAIATALKTDGDPRPLDFVRALVFQALLLGQDPFLGVVLDLPPDPADAPTEDESEGSGGGSAGHRTGPVADTQTRARAKTGADDDVSCTAQTGATTETQTEAQTEASGRTPARTAAANANALAKIQAEVDAEAELAADRRVAA